MALTGMPHRMHVDGRRICAWCAYDTLFLPELLGATVAIESTCPTTGEPVALTVGGAGVRDVAPPGAVLSFLRRDKPFDADTINSFCHYLHFFASQAVAREWTAAHEGTFVLSIEDGFEIARRINRSMFGAVLDRAAQAEGSA